MSTSEAGAGGAATDARTELRDLLLSDESLVKAVASGRQRNRTVPYRRVEVRYVDVSAGRKLQITSFDSTQSHTRNVGLGPQSVEAVDDLVDAAYSHWHVQMISETVQLHVSKKGRPLLHRVTNESPARVDHRHDRVKDRRLPESDPLYHLLGVATADGHIKPTRVAKFRQVQDLLAALDPVVDDALSLGPGPALSRERPLRVVDLGCGNAYLTFAAFRYLSEVKALPIRAIGIDVKAQSRTHNSEVAEQLGMSDGLTFVESTIADADVPQPPDLVLALHACDTATDAALARAVQWGAPVILAAPCCHHDIQRQLTAETGPAAYRLITRHGILKERFADVLTDALRAAVLRLVGYRVEVMEFVDSQHTPRNALIRAVRSPAGPLAQTLDAYRELVWQWGVQPALATMLSGDYPILDMSIEPVGFRPDDAGAGAVGAGGVGSSDLGSDDIRAGDAHIESPY